MLSQLTVGKEQETQVNRKKNTDFVEKTHLSNFKEKRDAQCPLNF